MSVTVHRKDRRVRRDESIIFLILSVLGVLCGEI